MRSNEDPMRSKINKFIKKKKNGEVGAPALEYTFSRQAVGGAALQGSHQRGGGGVLSGPGTAALLRLQIKEEVPGATILN